MKTADEFVGQEIEITEEMIAAAEYAFSEFDPRFEGAREMLCRVFLAMARLSPERLEPARDVGLLQAIETATAMLERATALTLEFTNVDNGDGTLRRTAERLIADVKPTSVLPTSEAPSPAVDETRE
jgi:hypothetical protein